MKPIMQGDTDRRTALLENENGPINLYKYSVIFVMDDDLGHYYEIPCVPQKQSDPNFTSRDLGGIAVPFSQIVTSIDGFYTCQFVLTDSTGAQTYPLGDPIQLQIIKKVKHDL
jgi:hypothetical protein